MDAVKTDQLDHPGTFLAGTPACIHNPALLADRLLPRIVQSNCTALFRGGGALHAGHLECMRRSPQGFEAILQLLMLTQRPVRLTVVVSMASLIPSHSASASCPQISCP